MNQVNLTGQISDEMIDYILSDSGASYWQSWGKIDTEAKTLTAIYENEDGETEKKVITFTDIANAIGKIATGEVKLNSDIKAQALSVLLEGEDGAYDADLGDCATQIALFGDVIFG